MKAQPIATAPRDGTVILTDVGTVCYVDPRRWASPVTEGWWLCQPDCQPDMVDDLYPVDPTCWVPMPKLEL